ncbi:hypothetical protein UlMin_031948 [Ulmus minor]
MANTTKTKILLFVITFIFAAFASQVAESRTQALALHYHKRVSDFSPTQPELLVQGSKEVLKKKNNNPRRMTIGSTAPTCTYNECRGCKYKCRAEQVPVEGNDPINSAYHYRCVCHR